MSRSLQETLRLLGSRNLLTAQVANRVFGLVGSKDYRAQSERSELIDGISDVASLIQIRDSFRQDDAKPRFPDRIDSNNRMYGIKRSLFGARHRELTVPAIEHGLFLGDFVIPADTIETGAPAVATFGSYRKRVIQARQDVPVFEVGPYIHYAQPHVGFEQLLAMKEKLGRTLLVYISHSTWDAQIERAADPFSWIEEYAAEFESVIVSVFWWDLEREFVRDLLAKGYHVTSCGLMHDRNFLARQKTVLMLADFAIGDGVGTHSGYCLHEGVPYRFVDVNTRVILNQAAGRESQEFGTRASMDVVEAVKDIFRDADQPPEQMRRDPVLNELWGFDSVRTGAELESILNISRRVARRSWGNRRNFLRALETIVDEGAGDEGKLLVHGLRANGEAER